MGSVYAQNTNHVLECTQLTHNFTACLKLGVGGDGQSFLRKIMPRPEPWNNLELPEGHKHIVQSLIESHFAKDNMRRINFDLVRGKGLVSTLHCALWEFNLQMRRQGGNHSASWCTGSWQDFDGR